MGKFSFYCGTLWLFYIIILHWILPTSVTVNRRSLLGGGGGGGGEERDLVLGISQFPSP